MNTMFFEKAAEIEKILSGKIFFPMRFSLIREKREPVS